MRSSLFFGSTNEKPNVVCPKYDQRIAVYPATVTGGELLTTKAESGILILSYAWVFMVFWTHGCRAHRMSKRVMHNHSCLTDDRRIKRSIYRSESAFRMPEAYQNTETGWNS